MKITTLALALMVSVNGLAQSGSKVAAGQCQYWSTVDQANHSGPCSTSDPDYIGEVHHKSHKLRNILIVSGIAAGTVAVVVLTHSAASHGSSGQYPSVTFTPIKAVQK